jgi:ABC-type bacteriocin/lantibiotic exporter with double-glycine peptidase domain
MTNVQKVWCDLVIGLGTPVIVLVAIFSLMSWIGTELAWIVPVVILTSLTIVFITVIMRAVLKVAREKDAAEKSNE